MAFPDRRTASVFLTVLFFSTVLLIIYLARAVIVIFAFAILFAYLIDPIVRFLQRHSLCFKNLRGPHVVETYVALLVFIALLVHILAPGSLGRTVRFVQQLPAWTERVSTGEIADDMAVRYGWNEEQTQRVKTLLVRHRSDIESATGEAKRTAKTALAAVIVIPILAIFFLSDGEKLADQVIGLVSTKQNHAVVRSVADDLNDMLRHYIRAKVTLGALSTTYASLWMILLGFPHAVTLGILAGILEFIPIAGWMTAAATILIVGAISHSPWIWMAAALGVWRILIDYWIAPRVLGHELEMHPLLAIFTLMAGGAIGGFVGVYLALPFVAAARVIWRRFASPAQPGGDDTGQLPLPGAGA